MRAIQQTLHGYREGHKLLRASIRLPTEAAHQILVASDATGPAARTGFSSYLSGFPVPQEQLYVLARTWFAPEMPRPGCVWTHSLLVPFNVLDDLEDLVVLLTAHRRPNAELSGYEEALEIPNRKAEVQLDQHLEQVLRSILLALYSGGDKAVVMALRNNELIEVEVVRLWSQQWAALRRHFSFCTGQLAERPSVNRADLQLVPSERRFRWRDAGALLLDETEPPPANQEVDVQWVDRAVDTLHYPSSTATNDVFNAAPAERRLFPVFIELRHLQSPNWLYSKRALERVAAIYPEPEQASDFKHALLGEWTPLRIDDNVTAFVVWAESSPAAAAFDGMAMCLDKRLRLLWTKERENAIQLLRSWLAKGSQSILKQMLAAAESELSRPGLLRLAAEEAGLLSALVADNPSILGEAAVWTHGTHLRREATEALLNSVTNAGLQLPLIIKGMTQARALDALGELVRKADDSTVVAALPALVQAIQIHSGWESHSLFNALQSRAGAVLAWLRTEFDEDLTGEQVLALLCEPSRQNADRLGAECLGRFVSHSTKRSNAEVDSLRFVPGTFALMCAIDHDASAIVRAGAGAFGLIHHAASERRLDDCSLHWLYRGLPRLDFWREWDLCEKMRVAVAEKLLTRQWEGDVLFMLLWPGSDFDRLLRTIVHQKGGKKFLRNLEGSVGHQRASQEHIRQLRDWT